VCPEKAIYQDTAVPDNQTHFIKINRELSTQWPAILKKKLAPSDAAQWSGVADKLKYLER
jgi:ferredoxin